MLRPIDAEDLSGLPPPMLLVSEINVLYDAQQAYAERLAEAGIEVEFVVGEGMSHIFTSFAHIFPSARHSLQIACDATRKTLHA